MIVVNGEVDSLTSSDQHDAITSVMSQSCADLHKPPPPRERGQDAGQAWREL